MEQGRISKAVAAIFGAIFGRAQSNGFTGNAAQVSAEAPKAAPTVESLTADLRKLANEQNIEQNISAALKSAQRDETPRPTNAHIEREKIRLRGGVLAQDLNWGAIFEGTRAQLVRAGLMPASGLKFKDGASGNYQLPLNRAEGYNDACFIRRGERTIPQAWEARAMKRDGGSKIDAVYVEFDTLRDLNVRERTEIAVAALERGDPRALELVKQIPPVPLSVAVPAQIARMDAEYGRTGRKPAWLKLQRERSGR